VPQPVRAVILIFPERGDQIKRRDEEDARISKEGQPKLDKTIMFIKQTVRPFIIQL
jgi:ubiquitin carboxyl-terminal hydrolase L3